MLFFSVRETENSRSLWCSECLSTREEVQTVRSINKRNNRSSDTPKFTGNHTLAARSLILSSKAMKNGSQVRVRSTVVRVCSLLFGKSHTHGTISYSILSKQWKKTAAPFFLSWFPHRGRKNIEYFANWHIIRKTRKCVKKWLFFANFSSIVIYDLFQDAKFFLHTYIR